MIRWWRRRRELTLDHCAVCDSRLRRGGAWEVRYNPQRAEDGYGGTFLSLTYCRKHRPTEARRAP